MPGSKSLLGSEGGYAWSQVPSTIFFTFSSYHLDHFSSGNPKMIIFSLLFCCFFNYFSHNPLSFSVLFIVLELFFIFLHLFL